MLERPPLWYLPLSILMVYDLYDHLLKGSASLKLPPYCILHTVDNH